MTRTAVAAAIAATMTLVATTAQAQDYPGRDKLRAQSAEFRREVIQVANTVYVAVGYAASNVVLVQGTDGSIIVDTTGMGIEAVLAHIEGLMAGERAEQT